MEGKEKKAWQHFADTVMGMPYGFSVGGRRFFLYPMTLGKMFYLQRIVEAMGIDMGMMQLNESFEALRLATEQRARSVEYISCNTCKGREEIVECMEERKAFLDKELSEEDIASLLIVLFSSDKTQVLLSHYGIAEEQERMAKVLSAKDDKNSLTFGGKTVFGTLIDAACERYGWTKDYAVWGIDYSSLRLMLADKVSTVYCSDEELKKLPLSVRDKSKEERINGDDRVAVMNAIKSQSWE